MAALLVAMSIMAVMMTVAMPVWKQASQREKEEELVFRGEQYARAIGLFKRKFANASPPNLDLLVEQRFLRKKFKDPITKDDFQPLTEGQAGPGAAAQPAAGRGTAPPSTPGPTGGTPAIGALRAGISAIGTPGAGAVGGIIGVTSKSKDKSIRLYKGRSHYNEWAFVYTQPAQAPGAGAPGAATPGQRGQPPQPGGSPFGPGPLGPGRGRGTGRGQPPNFPPGSRGSTVGPDGRIVPMQPTTPRGRGPGGH